MDKIYQYRGISGLIFKWVRNYKERVALTFISKDTESILICGARDDMLEKKLQPLFLNAKIVSMDINPKAKSVVKDDIMNISYPDNSFDVVIAIDVLEHVNHPIQAMKELNRVAKNKVIIGVPHEPMYTATRLILGYGWEREHLTYLSPKFIKAWLGNPLLEKIICFSREYVALFAKEKEDIWH